MGKKYVHNEQLMCSVISLAYAFPTHRGQIRFRSGDCCDMGGCLKLFKAIDPNVTAIYTFSGDEPDTGYFRERNGKWKAYQLIRKYF